VLLGSPRHDEHALAQPSLRDVMAEILQVRSPYGARVVAGSEGGCVRDKSRKVALGPVFTMALIGTLAAVLSELACPSPRSGPVKPVVSVVSPP
jgi:hypothetical protein